MRVSIESWLAFSDSLIHLYDSGAVDNCNDDIGCLSMASTDRLGLEAIRSLHQQLDDDANGNIDLSESDDVCCEFNLQFSADFKQFSADFNTVKANLGLTIGNYI